MGRDAKINSVEGSITFADGRTAEFSLFDMAGAWTWQQGGMDATRLAQRASGDILDKLAEAIAEHQQDNLPSVHWHVGNNTPGCLPEGDVRCLDTPDEAKDALEDELRQAQLALPVCESPVPNDGTGCGTCPGCMAHNEIDDLLTSDRWSVLDVRDGFAVNIADSALPRRYWIEPVPAADCDLREE